MPHRVSPKGSFRLDRIFPGVGRINLSSGAKTAAEYRKRDALLSELYETGHLELLRAIRARRLTVAEVFAAQRTQRLSYLAADVLLTRPLWPELEAWFPRSARTIATRRRYEVSWRALKRRLAEAFPVRVADLVDVPWGEVASAWGRSPADWNHLRRAVSRFLSTLLGDKWHPFRRLVLKDFPRARESKGRVPDLSPTGFWKIVNAAPAHVRSAYVTLAVTGLRVGEYLRLKPEDLRAATYGLHVPGTKTAGSDDVVVVGEEWWSWVKNAVPAPLGYAWLRKHWSRACAAVHVTGVTLHSLRHCCGQWAVNAGVPEAQVQAALRHETPGTTRIYTLQKARGQVARALAGVLLSRSPSRRGRRAR
ncbi:MAG: hypothetical protein DMD33_17585 [Gemmatimonadetes bacterium]|nr:MAG: hypothetical protein DMD33_17585 [Gemmatimonadota bacterium]